MKTKKVVFVIAALLLLLHLLFHLYLLYNFFNPPSPQSSIFDGGSIDVFMDSTPLHYDLGEVFNRLDDSLHVTSRSTLQDHNFDQSCKCDSIVIEVCFEIFHSKVDPRNIVFRSSESLCYTRDQIEHFFSPGISEKYRMHFQKNVTCRMYSADRYNSIIEARDDDPVSHSAVTSWVKLYGKNIHLYSRVSIKMSGSLTLEHDDSTDTIFSRKLLFRSGTRDHGYVKLTQ
ncbi:MAG: hypothetical protein LBK06_03605 [Planctomycetaceae bacterium]|nr:hypothetical protein [Planctomycetaceae bacterium]